MVTEKKGGAKTAIEWDDVIGWLRKTGSKLNEKRMVLMSEELVEIRWKYR